MFLVKAYIIVRMEARPGSAAKSLLVFLGICLFLALFAAIDTSEQVRTWRAAREWTLEQKSLASGLDADKIFPLIFASLVLDTAAIAFSLAGGLTLGIAVAVENKATFSVARALAWIAAACGIIYSIFMIVYEIELRGRTILKGPIFDYNLRPQLTILAAIGGFPVVALLFEIVSRRRDKTTISI